MHAHVAFACWFLLNRSRPSQSFAPSHARARAHPQAHMHALACTHVLNNKQQHQQPPPHNNKNNAQGCLPLRRDGSRVLGCRQMIYTIFADPSSCLLARIISLVVMAFIFASVFNMIIESVPDLQYGTQQIRVAPDVLAQLEAQVAQFNVSAWLADVEVRSACMHAYVCMRMRACVRVAVGRPQPRRRSALAGELRRAAFVGRGLSACRLLFVRAAYCPFVLPPFVLSTR
jgi:hypothetical protein